MNDLVKVLLLSCLIIFLLISSFLLVGYLDKEKSPIVFNETPQILWVNGSGNICMWQGEYFICEEIDTKRIFRTDKDLNEIK